MGKMSVAELRNKLRVYFILGSPNCRQEPVRVLKEAIAGGITLFQYREKGKSSLTGDKKYALAEELQFYCKKEIVPFIVNDDIDLAVALKADGVHIGQEDGPVEEIRERIGDKLLGVSVHDREEARIAIAGGADYFGVGPIYPTKTKEDANPVQGLSILGKLRSEGISLPIVGIGGISIQNAASVIGAGADGVSVISAISTADDIRDAAAQLKQQVDFAIKGRNCG